MKKFLILSLIGFGQLNVLANEYNFDYYGKTNSSNTPPDLDLSTFTEKELNTNFSRNSNGWLYTVNSETKESTLRSTQLPNDAEWSTVNIDPKTKRLFVEAGSEGSESVHIFDPVSNTWSTTCQDSSSYEWSDICDYKVPTGFEWDSSANSSIKVGNSNNPTVINSNGISGIITRDSSTGITKIGQNSLNFQEFSGSQPLKVWGTNTSGKTVPINIIDKLLINGRDVEQSINNVGAMSAALTGLPTVPTDTTLACGLGTGTHGGDFAFSGGCASKVNEKLSINYAASVTMPGQDYAGDFEDKFSARAGFIWKLGKAIKPTQISMQDKNKMETKIESLEENNKKIISQNKDLKQNNQLIISQNKSLLAKLERLEKIAFGESKFKDLAIYKLK